MIEVRAFILGYYPIRGFLAWRRGDAEALLVDPGGWDEAIMETLRAERLSVSAIAVTHGHGDHTGGLAQAAERTHARVHIHAHEAGGLPLRADALLRGGEEIEVGSVRWRAIHVPGHTPGHLAYAAEDVVFTGDCLFAGSVGGTSTVEAYEEQRAALRARILTLGDATRVYPAHGPASTVGVERKWNPFLR